ncbi:hypothetical protein [Streptomyces sp. NPDC001492]
MSFARGVGRRRLEQLLAELVQQLPLMTEEMRRANLIQHYRLIVEQNDPSPAEASSTRGSLSDARRR